MEVEMKIRGLMMDPVTNMPIVVLKDVNGNAILPIWVGIYEANAIALEIEKVSTPRPMTHDLIKILLLGMDTGIRKVVVSELKDDTFYAVIWLDKQGELISVDSRPERCAGAGAEAGLPDLCRRFGAEVVEDGRLGDRQGQQRRIAALAREPQRRGSRPLQDVSGSRGRSHYCSWRWSVSGRQRARMGAAASGPGSGTTANRTHSAVERVDRSQVGASWCGRAADFRGRSRCAVPGGSRLGCEGHPH